MKVQGYLQSRQKAATEVKVIPRETMSVAHTTRSMFSLCWQETQNCHNHITSSAARRMTARDN